MYNHTIYDIKKPYNKGLFFLPKLHIAAKDKRGRSHYYDFNALAKSATVVIYSSSKNGYVFDSREIFGTIVHELAHVSHWEIGYTTEQYMADFIGGNLGLPESWATGVEYIITENTYPALTFGSYDFNYGQSRTLKWIQTQSNGYTPIVMDMIDSFNQSTLGTNYPNDRVSAYTLGELERALPREYGSWWRWRTRIREMYDNPTENDELDYLFREYN